VGTFWGMERKPEMKIKHEALIVTMRTVTPLATGVPVYAIEEGKCAVAMAHCPENPMKHEVMGVAQHDAFTDEDVPILVSGWMPGLLDYVSTGDRTYESLLGETLFLGERGGLTVKEPPKPAQVVSVGFVITGRGDVYIRVQNRSAKRTEVMDGQCKFCRGSVDGTAIYCGDCIQMMDHVNDVARNQPLSEEFRKWTVRTYNKMAFRFEKTCTECNARDGTVRPDADELDYYCESCAMELSGND
jgi:hypothetical protein